MSRYYDLSQPIETGMTIFPGDPAVRVRSGDASAPWLVSRLELGTHSGTHIDAASHLIPGGRTIDQYGIDRFVLPGVVVSVLGLGEDEAIGAKELGEVQLLKGGGVIIQTDWSRYWGTERYLRHPYLTAEAAERIAAAGVGLVAIDALNVDSTVQETDHAHEILLGQDILIVENLARLAQLETGKVYQFSFLPLLLAGLDGSPVRAVAWE